MPIEQEAKFILTDTNKYRTKIIGMGGHSEGRVFETNVCYENAEGSFEKNKSILRLRQDRRVRLTFKSPSDQPASDPLDQQVKTMNEIEVSVGDFDTMHQLLSAIGFHPAQTYEKWRETFILGDAELCLDEMPFGAFLEIESTPDRVQHLSAGLGLPWKRRVLFNYLAIFALIKKTEKLPFNDITFANFKPHPINLERYATLIEAGT